MNMTRTILAVAISMASTGLLADNTQERIEKAEQRLEYLEKRLQNQNEAIASKQNKGANWTDTLEVSGVIEVEAASSDPENADDASDITVATAELGLVANISDELNAELVFLHEEDDTDFEVDVAQFSYALNDNWSLVAGQLYIPFGAYETGLVSDPITLDLGETRETVLMMNYEGGAVSGSVYIFNGDNKDTGKDEINNWGANIAYSRDNVSFGLAYINDLLDSDSLQDVLNSSTVTDYAGGLAANVTFNAGNFTLIAEQVAATDTFNDAPVAGDKPKARNLELDYALAIAGKPATIAFAAQSSEDAANSGLPEKKRLVGLSIDVTDNIGLGLEYSKEEDYSDVQTNNLLAQIAVSF